MTDYLKVTELTEASNIATTDIMEVAKDQGDTTFLSQKITWSNVVSAINTTNDVRYLKLDATNDPLTGNLSINGSSDAVQLTVKGNGTQSNDLVQVLDSAGTSEYLSVGASDLVINEIGADRDTRIEGDNNANLLYVDAGNDRIGIGTASPGVELDVAGLVRLRKSTTNTTLTIGADTSYGPKLAMQINGNDVAQYFISSGNTYFDYAGNLYFRIGINGSSALFISSTGLLGIGTTSPISTYSGVDISSGGHGLIIGAQNQAITRTDSTTKVARIAMPHYTNAEEPICLIYGISEADADYTTVSIGGGTAYQNAATFLQFVTASTAKTTTGTVRMAIDKSGNVGIGTTAPNNKLEVKDGNIALSDTDVTNPFGAWYYTNDFGNLAPLSGTAGGLHIIGISDTNATALQITANMGSADPTDTTPAINIVAKKSDGGTGVTDLGATETVLKIKNNANQLVVIQGNGKVGIGTTDAYLPQSQLQVAVSTTSDVDLISLQNIKAGGWQPTKFLDLSWRDATAVASAIGMEYNSTKGCVSMHLHSFYNAGYKTNTTRVMIIEGRGRVGIGSTDPDKILEINSSTGGTLRLSYNAPNGSATNYIDLAVSSSGDLTITPSGGDVKIVGTSNVTAGQIHSIIEKTSDYTILGTDYTILANCASNTVTLTLPASPVNGQVFNIKCINDTYTCTVGRGGKLIDGDASDFTMIEDEVICIQYCESNGSWWII